MPWSRKPLKNQLRFSDQASIFLSTKKDKNIFPTIFILGGDMFLVANDWTEKCLRLKTRYKMYNHLRIIGSLSCRQGFRRNNLYPPQWPPRSVSEFPYIPSAARPPKRPRNAGNFLSETSSFWKWGPYMLTCSNIPIKANNYMLHPIQFQWFSDPNNLFFLASPDRTFKQHVENCHCFLTSSFPSLQIFRITFLGCLVIS